MSGCLEKWDRLMQWPQHTHLRYLVASPWRFTPLFLVTFRIFSFMWALGTIVASEAIVYDAWLKFFVYLTNWNQLGVTFYFLLSAYIGIRAYLDYSYVPYKYMYRLVFVLAQHTVTLSIVVIILFWATEYPTWDPEQHDQADLFFNVCAHGITLFWAFVDLFLSNTVIVWPRHVFYTIVVVSVYGAVNGVYVVETGSPLYAILKWDGPIVIAVLAGTLAFLVLSNTMCWAMVKLRIHLSGVDPTVNPTNNLECSLNSQASTASDTYSYPV